MIYLQKETFITNLSTIVFLQFLLFCSNSIIHAQTTKNQQQELKLMELLEKSSKQKVLSILMGTLEKKLLYTKKSSIVLFNILKKSKSRQIRFWTLYAIGNLRYDRKKAVRKLRDVLKNTSSSSEQIAAMTGLQRQGLHSTLALPTLQKLLRSKKTQTTLLSDIFQTIGATRLSASFLASDIVTVTKKHPTIANFALKNLLKIAKRSQDTYDLALWTIKKRIHTNLTIQAIETLQENGLVLSSKHVFSTLISMYLSPKNRIDLRAKALLALCTLEGKSMYRQLTPHILTALKHKDEQILMQVTATKCLKHLPHIQKLFRVARTSKTWKVRLLAWEYALNRFKARRHFMAALECLLDNHKRVVSYCSQNLSKSSAGIKGLLKLDLKNYSKSQRVWIIRTLARVEKKSKKLNDKLLQLAQKKSFHLPIIWGLSHAKTYTPNLLFNLFKITDAPSRQAVVNLLFDSTSQNILSYMPKLIDLSKKMNSAERGIFTDKIVKLYPNNPKLFSRYILKTKTTTQAIFLHATLYLILNSYYHQNCQLNIYTDILKQPSSRVSIMPILHQIYRTFIMLKQNKWIDTSGWNKLCHAQLVNLVAILYTYTHSRSKIVSNAAFKILLLIPPSTVKLHLAKILEAYFNASAGYKKRLLHTYIISHIRDLTHFFFKNKQKQVIILQAFHRQIFKSLRLHTPKQLTCMTRQQQLYCKHLRRLDYAPSNLKKQLRSSLSKCLQLKKRPFCPPTHNRAHK